MILIMNLGHGTAALVQIRVKIYHGQY